MDFFPQSDAEPQNSQPDQNNELIPRMLPDLGPRISLQDLLFSDYLGGSPAGMITLSGSLSDLANGLLGSMQSGSLGNLHGGSPGHLHGGSLGGGSLFGPNGPHGAGRVPPARPIQNPSQRPSQRPPQASPPQGMSQKAVQLPTPEDGCGISPVRKSRIVGGVPAKNGAYPWMALLGLAFYSIFLFFAKSFASLAFIITYSLNLSICIHFIDIDLETEYRSTAVRFQMHLSNLLDGF